ncbi:MAG: glycosyltransferase [Oscillospiraceae bacterium]|jgi:GT2 family glycosyltransferase|nr:glycosyltransferase [Oscillospiraceae bacterium]
MNAVSVVMINKNRGFCIEHSLKAIINQLEDGDEFFVVDDNSDDDSVEVISKYIDKISALITCNSKGNLAYVRNMAVESVNNPLLLFVDSDTTICSGNINIIRKLFDDKEIVGASGTVFGNGHDEAQFELLSGLSPSRFYEKFIENPDILYDYPEFLDYRYFYANNPDQDLVGSWRYYFGCYNAVRTSIYRKLGGFDEFFTTWGSEDIELGYRLSKKGKVVYLKELLAFHHPHGKNMFRQAKSDIPNMYFILNKHRCFDLEIFCAFKQDIEAWKIYNFRYLCKYMAENNNSEFADIGNSEADLHFPDLKHPNGIIRVMKNDVVENIELFGFAVPFADKSISKVYISGAYSMLSDILLAIVLQEALRYAEVVLVSKKTIDTIAAPFDCPGTYNGNPLMKNCCYISQFIENFIFEDYNEDYVLVSMSDDVTVVFEKSVQLC